MLLKFIIKDFLDDRKFRNLSPKSISDYAVTLNEFHQFSVDRGVVDINDVTHNVIKSYFIECQNRDNKPSTINHKMRNIKVFFSYCCSEEIINPKQNPTAKLSYQKEEIKIVAFSDYHITQMLNYYRRLKGRDKIFYSYRDYTIILCLLGTGIRLGELCSLKWTDIDLSNDKMTVIGKKRVQRTIPIVEKLKRELLEWGYFQEKYFSCDKRDKYVFVNIKNEKLTENAVSNIFKHVRKIMNFKDVRLSAHTFRHTFSKNWIMAGGDIFSLQRILGHSKIDMTKKYANLYLSAVQEQNDKYNPLNNLDF